jgi:type IV pilus assembly protein PilY1
MQPRFPKVLSLVLLALCCSAHAEDIDLFVGAPSSAGDLPNVLFIIDNTANWNQAFANEMAALENTFRNLPVNDDGSAKFNVGIMLANETGSPNSNIKGGYVRAALRPMTGGTGGNKTLYADLIASLDNLDDKGNGGYSALTMAEAYYYFTSGTPYAGNNKIKADYRGNVYGTTASRAVYALSGNAGGNALDSIDATTYAGPNGSTCSKQFIIYISNGPNQQNSSTDTLANSMLSAAGGSTTQIPLSPSGSQSNPSDEWARFMATRNIVTYTIDVDPLSSGQGPGWTVMLERMASVSGGKYAAVNSATGSGEQISDAVNEALSEIQAVNSVFASVSLPLSVNTQGTHVNQVYVGMFRPDADGLPRWTGNLKQYKLGYVDDVLRLQDADSRYAINATTGFVTECARSFWTPQTTDTYWAFNPQGVCIPPTGSAEDLYRVSNSPDGNVVEKGAHAYRLRGTTSRSLKTCSPVFASCTSLTDFNTGNSAISQPLLNASSGTERDLLINWARGLDLGDENQNSVTSEMRPSVHGDVVHSRPVAVNLGSEASPQIIVLYGGNDGVLRAINGNRDQSIGSIPAGGELWAFMPPEFYGHIKRLYDNDIQISFPNITTGNPLPKPYGIDGPISAYRQADSAWIYATMRRGGRALYAFDIDVDDPTNITLKWKQGCPNTFAGDGSVDDTGCSSGLSDVGQTWSQAKILKAAGYSSGSAPLLIMGGGYDPCEDADPHTCDADSKGAKVYVLDPDDGAVLNSFSTGRSVIADVAVVTDPTTGLALHAYAVDLGGNVYRVNIGTSAPSSWTITKIASLGCDTTASCTRNRKFMFAPSVLFENGSYILLLGSGDREKPREYNNQVENYFFMLKDRPADSTWLSTESGACGSAVICLSSLVPIMTDANPSQDDLAAKKGWYLGMLQNEQVVTSAITIFGTVTFSTHEPRRPQAGVCSSNLGIARVYNVWYSNAASANGTNERSEELPGSVGLPPSPVGGAVTLDDGQTVPFCIGCRPESPLEGEEPEVPPSSAPSQPKSRVYWYIQR